MVRNLQGILITGKQRLYGTYEETAQIGRVFLYPVSAGKLFLFGIQVLEDERVELFVDDGAGENQFESVLFHLFRFGLQRKDACGILMLYILAPHLLQDFLTLWHWHPEVLQLGREDAQGVCLTIVDEHMKGVRSGPAVVHPDFKTVVQYVELGDELICLVALNPKRIDPCIGGLE